MIVRGSTFFDSGEGKSGVELQCFENEEDFGNNQWSLIVTIPIPADRSYLDYDRYELEDLRFRIADQLEDARTSREFNDELYRVIAQFLLSDLKEYLHIRNVIDTGRAKVRTFYSNLREWM